MRARAGIIPVALFLAVGAVNAVTGILKPPGASAEQATVAYTPGKGRASEQQLNRWIDQALAVMQQQNIPGTREGIWRIMMVESGGNPDICNTSDINAKNGTPSCGLMQVIQPTFDAHHCPGTADRLTDPVANICAASHYAWKRYKSIDHAPTPY